MKNDSITIIDFDKKISDIENLHELPPATIAFLKSKVDNLQASGFQEILGYQDRTCVISLGGYWTGTERNKFIVTSYGTGKRDFGISKQWSRH